MNRSLAVIVLVCGLAACTHGQVVESSSSQSSAHAVMVATEPAPPTETAPATVAEVPLARTRLSQTVTLGQGSDPAYVPSAPPPKVAAQGNPTIVVNNTVVVQNGGYGGYGGYYGGYGGYVATPSRMPDGRSSGGSPSPAMWSTTGWEGARRTAAPGQTPGVGGNWSPPPSYGPAQMK